MKKDCMCPVDAGNISIICIEETDLDLNEVNNNNNYKTPFAPTLLRHLVHIVKMPEGAGIYEGTLTVLNSWISRKTRLKFKLESESGMFVLGDACYTCYMFGQEMRKCSTTKRSATILTGGDGEFQVHIEIHCSTKALTVSAGTWDSDTEPEPLSMEEVKEAFPQGVTKDELARFYGLTDYDTAIPQDLYDALAKLGSKNESKFDPDAKPPKEPDTFNPWGHFVFDYSDHEHHPQGRLFALTKEGQEVQDRLTKLFFISERK